MRAVHRAQGSLLAWTSAVLAGVALQALPAQAQTVSPAVGAVGGMLDPTQLHPRLDDDPVTPRMMAMGGRAEASSASTSALFGNPAVLASQRTYHADGLFLWDPTTNRFMSGSVLVDSTRQYVSGGLSYLYSNTNDAGDQRQGHDVRLSLSVPIANIVGLGVTGRYLNVTGSPPVLPGANGLQAGGWGGFTFDVGAWVKPLSFLLISASGRNINNPSTTAAPIALGMGASITPMQMLNITGDVLLDFRSVGAVRGRYSGGVELFIANRVQIRAGYMFDQIRGGAHAVTAGAGLVFESFGVELGMRQEVVPELQTTLVLAARYFYRAQ